MLRRLRRKLVCINMVLLMAMLCAILGLVVHFTRAGLEGESLRMMQAAAARPFDLRPPGGAPGEPGRNCFTVRIGREGQLFTAGMGHQEMSREELRALVDLALAQEAPSGVLAEYQLRYLRGDGPETCLVFANIYQERAALAQLTRTCVLAGGAGFVVLLGVSLLLARWAVRPVERAWAQQKQFVADASHELKTPLTVIITSAELLQDPARTPDPQLAGSILTMARQMRGLVEDLLDLARLDGGRAELARERVDLSRVVSDAALPFEAPLFERQLELRTQVEEGVAVRGSAGRLRQVVEIFLDNAWKYADPGGEVAVTLRRSGRKCLLAVSSPGPEIPREELERIFRRFYRLDQARTGSRSYGLGLSIAQTIVTEHRGRIWAESAGGRNTFLVELRLWRGETPGADGGVPFL